LTEEDRKRRLMQARKLMVYSAFLMPFAFVWVLLSPGQFKILMPVLLALPWVAVWLTWFFKGILRLYVSKSKPYPTLLMTVIITEFATFAAVFREYDIYLFDGRFWGLVLALSVVVLLVWSVACRAAVEGERNLPGVYAGMLLVTGLYSYTTLVFSNCAYDDRRPVITRVAVDGKHVSHGKSTSYFLELSPWGRFTDGKSAQVSYTFYNAMSTGDSVSVYLHPGKWGIAWYEVHRH
jgi:hypothetical protein